MNIGIVGTGSIAQAHAMGVEHMDQSLIRLHGCFDVNNDAMRKFAKDHPCKRYESLDAMLEDADIEAVVICLPHGMHAEVGIRCLESGRDVLVEKPMAPSVAECESLIQAADRFGKCLYIGHEYHLMEPVQRAREVLDLGELGQPLMVKSEVPTYIYGRLGAWWMDPELARGGPGINVGVHQVDAISYLLDTMPRAVRGYTRQLHPEAVTGIEDYLQMELDFNGIIAECKLYSFLKNVSKAIEPGVVVMCEQGYLRVWGRSLVVHHIDGEPEIRLETEPSKGYVPFIRQFEAFCSYVKDGKIPRATGEYGKIMVKCIEITVNSNDTDGWVEL